MRRLVFFLAVLLGFAVAALHAQTSSKIWRLGVLSPVDFELIRGLVLPELARNGFVEGRNLAIEFRWADGQLARLPMLAAELVERKVSVVFAGPSELRT